MVLRWQPGPTGQHIELGISEMNLFMLLGQLGLAAELCGLACGAHMALVRAPLADRVHVALVGRADPGEHRDVGDAGSLQGVDGAFDVRLATSVSGDVDDAGGLDAVHGVPLWTGAES